jgi:hypothetical protein
MITTTEHKTLTRTASTVLSNHDLISQTSLVSPDARHRACGSTSQRDIRCSMVPLGADRPPRSRLHALCATTPARSHTAAAVCAGRPRARVTSRQRGRPRRPPDSHPAHKRVAPAMAPPCFLTRFARGACEALARPNNRPGSRAAPPSSILGARGAGGARLIARAGINRLCRLPTEDCCPRPLTRPATASSSPLSSITNPRSLVPCACRASQLASAPFAAGASWGPPAAPPQIMRMLVVASYLHPPVLFEYLRAPRMWGDRGPSPSDHGWRVARIHMSPSSSPHTQ